MTAAGAGKPVRSTTAAQPPARRETISALQAKVTELTSQLAAAQGAWQARDDATAQVTALTTRLAERERELDDALDAKQQAVLMLSDAEAKVEVLTAELAAAHHDRDAAQERAAAALNEQGRKQELADGYRRELDATRRDRDLYKGHLATARKELDESSEQIITLTAAGSTAEAQRAELHRQLNAERGEAQGRIIRLEEQLAATVAEADEHRQSAAAYQMTMSGHAAALADDIYHARKQVTAAEQRKRTRGFRRSAARQQLAEARSALAALEKVAGRQT